MSFVRKSVELESTILSKNVGCARECVCVSVCARDGVCVEVREKLVQSVLSFHCGGGFWGLMSSYQALCQASLLTGPPHRPMLSKRPLWMLVDSEWMQCQI